jgi:hypothetical protein
MLDHPHYNSDKKNAVRIVDNLCLIGQKALELDANNELRTRYLKKMLHAYRKIASHSNSSIRESLNVPEELRRLLDCQVGKSESQLFALLSFLAAEAIPADFLRALIGWDRIHSMEPILFETVQNTLRRATKLSVGTELSGSLLRMRQAKYFGDTKVEVINNINNTKEVTMSTRSLWNRMSQGMIAIAK